MPNFRQTLGQSSLDILSLSAAGLPQFILDAIRREIDQKLYFDINYITDRINASKQQPACCNISVPVVTGNIDETCQIKLSIDSFEIKIGGHAKTRPSLLQFVKTVVCEKDCICEAEVLVSVEHDFHLNFGLRIALAGQGAQFNSPFFDIGNGESVPVTISQILGTSFADISYSRTVIKTHVFTFKLTCRQAFLYPLLEASANFFLSASTGIGKSVEMISGDGGNSELMNEFNKGCHLVVSVESIRNISGVSVIDPNVTWRFEFNVNGTLHSKSGQFDATGEFIVTSHPDRSEIFNGVYKDKCNMKITPKISVVATRLGPIESLGGNNLAPTFECTATPQITRPTMLIHMVNGEEIRIEYNLGWGCVS